MKIAICPGSFDPVTYGHLNIIERSAALVDKLIVAVFRNPNKHSMFTMEERLDMLKETTKHLPNVEVDAFDGLLNEYAEAKTAISSSAACGPSAILNMNFSGRSC